MKKYIPYLIILALAIFGLNQCSNNSANTKRYEQNLKAFQDSTFYYKNRLGHEVASRLSFQLTEKELSEQLKSKTEDNKRLKEALKKIKKPIVVVQSDQEIKIDTVYVPFEVPVECKFSFDKQVNKNWFSFNASVNQDGLTISDFELQNNQTLVVGWKSKSIFKSPELKAEITNTNPYFKQLQIKPIVIIYKRSWYEKPIYTIPLGFALGATLSKL